MPESSRVVRGLALRSVLLLVVVALATGQSSQQAPAPSPGRSTQTPGASAVSANSSDASKYVGAETCKTCHEEIYNSWEKTPHWKTTLNKEGGPSKQGCEGCHGPGADHVAGGGDKTKIFVFEGRSRQETSARCLTCHGEDMIMQERLTGKQWNAEVDKMVRWGAQVKAEDRSAIVDYLLKLYGPRPLK